MRTFASAIARCRPADEATDPDLDGEHTVNGVVARPALRLLAAEAAKFVPEEGGTANTDVPAEQIREFARLYATRRPAFIYPGFGVDRYTNGHLTGRGLATMAALTGNIGVSGAPGGDADEACAKAGIAAIQDKLDF